MFFLSLSVPRPIVWYLDFFRFQAVAGPPLACRKRPKTAPHTPHNFLFLITRPSLLKLPLRLPALVCASLTLLASVAFETLKYSLIPSSICGTRDQAQFSICINFFSKDISYIPPQFFVTCHFLLRLRVPSTLGV